MVNANLIGLKIYTTPLQSNCLATTQTVINTKKNWNVEKVSFGNLQQFRCFLTSEIGSRVFGFLRSINLIHGVSVDVVFSQCIF